VARVLPLRAVRALAPLRSPRGLALAGARLHLLGEGALWAFPRQGDGPGQRIAGEPGAAVALVAVPGGGVLALGADGAGAFWAAPQLGLPARPLILGPLRAALPPGAPGAACVRGDELVLALPDALAVCALAPLLDAVRAGREVPAAALLAVHPVPGSATGLDALPDGRLLIVDDDALTLVARDGGVRRRQALPSPRGAPGAAAPSRRIRGLLAALRGDGTVDLLLPAAVGGEGHLLGGALRL